jgi:hypothetical protein
MMEAMSLFMKMRTKVDNTGELSSPRAQKGKNVNVRSRLLPVLVDQKGGAEERCGFAKI